KAERVVSPIAVTPSMPGMLSSGSYPNRWVPGASRPPDSVSASVQSLAPAAPVVEVPQIRPMIPLGQFRDTFIIAVDGEGVAIIDQHVAHERVLFERAMERLTSGPLESQRLLVPIVMEVAPSAHQALTSRATELQQLGFELEDFGVGSVKVTAVPS